MINSCPEWACFSSIEVSSRERKGQLLKTVLFESCWHVYNDPIPSDAELEHFYRKNYRLQYKGTKRPRLRQIARNFQGAFEFIKRWSGSLQDRTKILNIGCGSGGFLYLMHRRGFNTSGVEPNLGYADYCRNELGINADLIFEGCLFWTGALRYRYRNHNTAKEGGDGSIL
jgi:hypothetical protein